MPAKGSKKRRMDETNVDNVQVKSKKWANEREVEPGVASSPLAELEALESRIERLHSGLDAARDILWASRYEPDLDVEALQAIVDYAHRTCYIAAPHGFVPGESQLFMMRPPAPQTMQFQQSILHQLAANMATKGNDLYNAKGGGPVVGANAGTALEHDTKTMTQNEGLRAQEGKPAEIGSKQQVVDMVEVLSHMPEMPPGWKPGDPIPGLSAISKTGEAETAKKPAMQSTIDPGPTAANTEKPPAQAAKKPTSAGFALGLEVDDLDFGLGSSSSDEDSD